MIIDTELIRKQALENQSKGITTEKATKEFLAAIETIEGLYSFALGMQKLQPVIDKQAKKN